MISYFLFYSRLLVIIFIEAVGQAAPHRRLRPVGEHPHTALPWLLQCKDKGQGEHLNGGMILSITVTKPQSTWSPCCSCADSAHRAKEQVGRKPNTDSTSDHASVYWHCQSGTRQGPSPHAASSVSICHNTCPHSFTLKVQHFKL